MNLIAFSTATALLLSAVGVQASTFTLASPAGGTLPSTVTPVGGVVLNLTGANGTRIVAEAAAGSEFIGSESSLNYGSTAYLLFAKQTGITSSVVGALGGGITSASFRITLYDGDNQLGNFDYNQNFLYAGENTGAVGDEATSSTGVGLGNFSTQTTQQTDSMGNAISSLSTGFGDDLLDTGFFSSTDATTLNGLYMQLLLAAAGDQTLSFQLRDNTNGDQYFDFTQGIGSSLVNVGTGPIVSTGVTPEPSSLLLLGTGLLSVAPALRSRKARTSA